MRHAAGYVLLLAVVAAGCTGHQFCEHGCDMCGSHVRKCEGHMVTVVAVDCVDERPGGQKPCRTVVEFPDGSRSYRGGQWGEVGDTFKARWANDGVRWH